MSTKPTKKKSLTPKGPGGGQGVDSLVSTYGKELKTGEEIRFTLVKGPDRVALADPVQKKAPLQDFPLIAKFSESVVKPDFSEHKWQTARLYQQDIPKAADDSDEEEDPSQPKKRWRSRNQKEVGRQWILQEQEEFYKEMMDRRQKVSSKSNGNNSGGDDSSSDKPNTSTRYVGIPEHNPSRYLLLETNAGNDQAHTSDGGVAQQNIQVTVLPTPFATINFSQPFATKTLSMREAADTLENQRQKATRYMMHDKQRAFQGQAPVYQSRSRLERKLMEKLSSGDGQDPSGGQAGKTGARRKRGWDDPDDDGDDVMADLRFEKRGKGSSAQSKARQELLSSFGDEATKVDADFVLGGANDSMFGSKGQRFGQFANNGGKKEDAANDLGHGAESEPGASAERGNDGLAMADDFYQRDVQAEYEELDYDANEQFDDDDVDVGETEVVTEDVGYDQEDDEDDFDDGEGGGHLEGAEGLASAKGFEILLKKARGELTTEQAAEEAAKSKRQAEEAAKRLAENDQDGEGDHLSKIWDASENENDESEDAAAQGASAMVTEEDKKYDDNGQRIITLQQVRREIWLNHNRIPMKRLLKIFNINKKTTEDRREAFKEVIRELCNMEDDPLAGGKILVLKQHYQM